MTLLSSGAVVHLKYDALYSLENYIRSFYCNTFPLTMYLQVQLIKVHCTSNAKNAIKYELKKE